MIRPLNLFDIDLCVKICKSAFETQGYKWDIEMELKSSFDHKQFIVPKYLVYEEEGIVRGFIGFNYLGFDDQAYGISACYIDKQWRGKGIGQLLYVEAIAAIKALGGKIIFITSKRSALHKLGFETIYVFKDNDWQIKKLEL